MACSVVGGDRNIPGGTLNGALRALSVLSNHSFDEVRRCAHSRDQRTAIAIFFVGDHHSTSVDSATPFAISVRETRVTLPKAVCKKMFAQRYERSEKKVKGSAGVRRIV